jgi:16S rRNA (cytosine967-C5)-methyltransferase
LKAIVHARDILIKIIEHNFPFTESVKKTIKENNVDYELQSLVRSLTSCELHHHLLLEHVVEKHFPHIAVELKLLLQVALGNNIYIKRLSIEEVNNFIISELKNSEYTEEQIDSFMRLLVPGKRLISPDIKENSIKYLSLKFNTPEWLIAMWQKHFGVPNTIRILKANTRPVLQACRINNFKASVDQVVEIDSEFKRGPIAQTVIYQGTAPLKTRQPYIDNMVFQQRLAVTDVVNKINFENLHGEVLIVESRPNALYLELPIVTNNRVKIHVATNSVERKLDMQKAIKNFQISKLDVFESNAKLLISHVSNPQDFVVVVANCTKFDLIRSLPDFLIHFKQDSIDLLIKEQKETLKEASQFVDKGGLLFYGVNTMNNKEGKTLITEFIEENPNFSIALEKQYFPFDKFNSALYIAALRRHNDT